MDAPYKLEAAAGLVYLTKDGEPFDLPLEDNPDNRAYLQTERGRLNSAYVLDRELG